MNFKSFQVMQWVIIALFTLALLYVMQTNPKLIESLFKVHKGGGTPPAGPINDMEEERTITRLDSAATARIDTYQKERRETSRFRTPPKQSQLLPEAIPAPVEKDAVSSVRCYRGPDATAPESFGSWRTTPSAN